MKTPATVFKQILFCAVFLSSTAVLAEVTAAQSDATQSSQSTTKPKAPTIPLCNVDAKEACDEKPKASSADAKVSAELKIKNAKDAAQGWHRLSPDETMQNARLACESEVKKYCANVKNGAGRIAKCLADHVDKLKPECRGYVAANGSGNVSSVPAYLAAPKLKPAPAAPPATPKSP